MSLQSVCRYENFFHFALAHLFLYGLLKDWATVWTDPSHPKSRADASISDETVQSVRTVLYTLPTSLKRQILMKAWRIVPTRQWNIQGASFGRCIPMCRAVP